MWVWKVYSAHCITRQSTCNSPEHIGWLSKLPPHKFRGHIFCISLHRFTGLLVQGDTQSKISQLAGDAVASDEDVGRLDVKVT